MKKINEEKKSAERDIIQSIILGFAAARNHLSTAPLMLKKINKKN